MRIDTGIAVIFVLAAALAFMPALTDRWAARRGASPEALVALAIVTLAGVLAVPVAFTICTAGAGVGSLGRGEPPPAAVAGLALVAIAAGRTLARMVAIRRRWRSIARAAASLKPPSAAGAVRVLPVGDLLAFAAGKEAFVSQGLLDRLNASQQRAVIEHEREHAAAGHARLSSAAHALAHSAFEILPARRATEALDRELDVLADLAAAGRVGDPEPVQSALETWPPRPPTRPTLAEKARPRCASSASPPATGHAVRWSTARSGSSRSAWARWCSR